MSITKTSLGLALALGAAAVVAQGQPEVLEQVQTDEVSPEARLPLRDLRVFADVFNQIRSSYVEEVDDRTLLEFAIKGMLDGLDPHSSYLDSDSFGELREATTGEFGGLGIEVGMDDGFVRVIAPIDDTPAARAGIQPGDLIIRLDGKTVKGLSRDEAVNLMRGDKGTKIRLTIIREGVAAPIEVTITRAIIHVTSVRKRMLEPGFGYLRIANFQAGTGSDVQQAIASLMADADGRLQGLVLDLRNNPGGVLQASVAVADSFLDSGLIVSTRGRVDKASTALYASEGDLLSGAPLVVLINGGSASASEIVAGALQDHKRAVILGTESFGKGSVQTVLPIDEERAIKLTTARYFTPSGRSIQAQGIHPDIAVERAQITSLEVRGRISEADLNRHLDAPDENPNGSGENDSRASEASAESIQDNQLYEALNVLRGIALYRSVN